LERLQIQILSKELAQRRKHLTNKGTEIVPRQA
jgi:hypothetical protein